MDVPLKCSVDRFKNSFWSGKPKVVATKLPTLTVAVGVKRMPEGLRISTVPPMGPPGPTVDWSMPAIVDGLPTATRFSDDEPAVGNWNSVVSPMAMLKLFQLMMDVLEDWAIVNKLPDGMIEALPLVTTPPSGLAYTHVATQDRKSTPTNLKFFIISRGY